MARFSLSLRKLSLSLLLGSSNFATASSITFIRHGESEHNVLIRANVPDACKSVRDPSLTDAGYDQAVKLHEELAGEEFDLIVTSPLTRTLETTFLAFEGRDIPIVFAPNASERRKSHSGNCQFGRDRETLAFEFPWVNFKSLAPDWPHTQKESSEDFKKRVRTFKKWLSQQKAKSIAVISHSGVLKELTGEKFKNCDRLKISLSGDN